jgi:hypothetical protein
MGSINNVDLRRSIFLSFSPFSFGIFMNLFRGSRRALLDRSLFVLFFVHLI